MELPRLFIPANTEQQFDVLSWEQVQHDKHIKIKKTEHHTSQYVGVHRKNKQKSFEAQIRFNKVAISLGTFRSEKMAAHASDLMVLWGELHPVACLPPRQLNFARETYKDFAMSLHAFDFPTMLSQLRGYGKKIELTK